MPDEWTIGRLTAAAGVHVETIRYDQRRGLLEEPVKPMHGRAETRMLAMHGLTAIERKLTELEAMRDALAEMVRRSDAGPTEGPCAILDVLSRDD